MLASSLQAPEQRAARNLEQAGSVVSVEAVLGHELAGALCHLRAPLDGRPETLAALAGGRQAGARAFEDEVALELGDST